MDNRSIYVISALVYVQRVAEVETDKNLEKFTQEELVSLLSEMDESDELDWSLRSSWKEPQRIQSETGEEYRIYIPEEDSGFTLLLP